VLFRRRRRLLLLLLLLHHLVVVPAVLLFNSRSFTESVVFEAGIIARCEALVGRAIRNNGANLFIDCAYPLFVVGVLEATMAKGGPWERCAAFWLASTRLAIPCVHVRSAWVSLAHARREKSQLFLVLM